MDNFKKYAENKIKIAELEKECEELKPELIEMVEPLKEPMKYAGGKFYLMTRKTYKFSKTTEDREKEAKERLSVLKNLEIEMGIAVESVSTSLVFSIDK